MRTGSQDSWSPRDARGHSLTTPAPVAGAKSHEGLLLDLHAILAGNWGS